MIYILSLIMILSSCGNSIKDSKLILDTVPEKYKDNPSEYILKSVQLAARLEAEISNAKKTNISQETQEKMAIVKKSGVTKDDKNVQDVKMFSASRLTDPLCPDDTIKGIKFDFAPLLSSLYRGQGLTSVTDLTFDGYGIYVRLSKHEATKPAEYNITEAEWAANYANKKTVFINYTQNSSGTTHKLLKDESGANIADNLGMICPNYCPTGD